MIEIKHWAWVNHDIPWHGEAMSACLPARFQIRRAITKVLEHLEGILEIVDCLGVPGTWWGHLGPR